jgi:hypothetical protein
MARLKVCHPERNEGSAVLEGQEKNADPSSLRYSG